MNSSYCKILIFTYGVVGDDYLQTKNSKYIDTIQNEYKCKIINTHWPHIVEDILKKYTDLLIINIVRLPIERNISAFWKTHKTYNPNYDNLEINEINNRYKKLDKIFSVTKTDYWMTNNIFKLFDIKIDDFKFNNNKKYLTFEKNNNTFLFYRYEDYKYIKKNVLPLFDINKFENNNNENKYLKNCIEHKKYYKLDSKEEKNIRESKILKLFYNNDEINSHINYWKKDMKDFKIVITTCKPYFKNILNLCKEISDLNFPKEKFLIISGQEDKYEETKINNIDIIKVNYTGLHLTGPIYINHNLDKFNDIKYFLFLPDTIKFGNNFYKNLVEFYNKNLKDNNNFLSIPIFRPSAINPTMDMGILHKNYIKDLSDYLLKIKTLHIDKENLEKLKLQLICDENTLLGINVNLKKRKTKTSTKLLNQNNITYLMEQKFIKRKITKRFNKVVRENYFEKLDLYKYQMNFRGPNKKLFMTID